MAWSRYDQTRRRGLRQEQKKTGRKTSRFANRTGYAVKVRFEKRNGRWFDKGFYTRESANRAIRAWRSKGGKVVSMIVN